MTHEDNFNSELNCLNDEYYLFYEMLMMSLKTDDFKDGIYNSLCLLKKFLSAGCIALYEKNTNGIYIHKISDLKVNESIKFISCIVNKTSLLTESKGIFNLDLNLSNDLKNIVLIYIKLGNNDFILYINNMDLKHKFEKHFWDKVRDTVQIILKRKINYENNIKLFNIDLLTGIDNRNSYEMKLQSLNELDNNLVFGLFDLFRLKYINDNYSHKIGDDYIKEVAKILKKYWPKYTVETGNDGEEIYSYTGHTLYRIGGDEFALFTNKENLDLTKIKSDLAKEEVSMIKFDTDNPLILGLNCGVVLHTPGDCFNKTFINADNIMCDDKRKMYIKHGLDRRK